jgi:hypothetical protein
MPLAEHLRGTADGKEIRPGNYGENMVRNNSVMATQP